MSELRSVYVTCPSVDVARRIARAAVEARVAACANLLPGESVYRWEGALVEEPEVVMFLKTTAEAAPRLVELVRREHPHEVPCIVVLPVAGAHGPYADWVAGETRDASSKLGRRE